jgi:hypothetical protein
MHTIYAHNMQCHMEVGRTLVLSPSTYNCRGQLLLKHFGKGTLKDIGHQHRADRPQKSASSCLSEGSGMIITSKHSH